MLLRAGNRNERINLLRKRMLLESQRLQGGEKGGCIGASRERDKNNGQSQIKRRIRDTGFPHTLHLKRDAFARLEERPQTKHSKRMRDEYIYTSRRLVVNSK